MTRRCLLGMFVTAPAWPLPSGGADALRRARITGVVLARRAAGGALIDIQTDCGVAASAAIRLTGPGSVAAVQQIRRLLVGEDAAVVTDFFCNYTALRYAYAGHGAIANSVSTALRSLNLRLAGCLTVAARTSARPLLSKQTSNPAPAQMSRLRDGSIRTSEKVSAISRRTLFTVPERSTSFPP
ncbi:MAG TPA: hypothetical protein VHB50_12965, partial [Bryobacteraceae bacterium]|nr:hypothetical protein [Bryobacteraceae bacterium]